MTAETIANRILISAGANPKNNGFRYLARAIVLEYENPENPGITKWLYPALAKEFRQSEQRIERCIRTVVHGTQSKHKTNGEFIRAAAWFLKEYLANNLMLNDTDKVKEALFEKCFFYYKRYTRELEKADCLKYEALFEVVCDLNLQDEYREFKMYSPLAR